MWSAAQHHAARSTCATAPASPARRRADGHEPRRPRRTLRPGDGALVRPRRRAGRELRARRWHADRQVRPRRARPCQQRRLAPHATAASRSPSGSSRSPRPGTCRPRTLRSPTRSRTRTSSSILFGPAPPSSSARTRRLGVVPPPRRRPAPRRGPSGRRRPDVSDHGNMTADPAVPPSIAEHVVEGLRALDIDTLFCLPGVQNDDFFDVLVDAGDIRPIVARHEQGAAYMAMGASQVHGRPAAFSVVPGPGLLNASAALTSAYWSNSRVLAVVGEIPTFARGRGFGVLHELVDQHTILGQLTKHATLLDDAATATNELQVALDQVVSGRPRPVSVEVPANRWATPAPGAHHPTRRHDARGRRRCDRARRRRAPSRRAPADRRRRRGAGRRRGGRRARRAPPGAGHHASHGPRCRCRRSTRCSSTSPSATTCGVTPTSWSRSAPGSSGR